ncbi:hypothetical protein KI387_021940, partial [Taxus chinensis]
PLMAESNAPEHQKRGLFGRRKEEYTYQQKYGGRDSHVYAQVGEPVYQDHRGNIHPLYPNGCRGERRMGANLNRSNGSSSDSSSEEEGQDDGEKNKKTKGVIKEKLPRGQMREGGYNASPFGGTEQNVSVYDHTEKREGERNASPYNFTKKKEGEHNVVPYEHLYGCIEKKGGEYNVVPYEHAYGCTERKEEEHNSAPCGRNVALYGCTE